VAAIDDHAALEQAGVVAVVPISEGVAVVGKTFDDAQRGLRALKVDWDDARAERRSSEELLAEHHRVLESVEGARIAREDGDVANALDEAEHDVDAVYEPPFLAHAPMEPNNAACRMRDDGVLEVWASTQSPEYTRIAASESGRVPKEQVQVHVMLAGGAFGLHSSATADPVAEVVEIASAMDWKYPIKVQSLRQEEFKSGRYRTMAVHRVRAGTDAGGHVTAYHQQLAAQPTGVNLPIVRDVIVNNGVDYLTVTGATDPPYSFSNVKVEVSDVKSGVPVMTWRSVGNSHTEFARESALDELAAAAGRDPVDLRRGLLAGSPRTLRALELAAERASWGSKMPEGHARGIACSNGFVSHSAQVVEISLDDRARIHIDRIVFALDCGIALNPDLVRAQVEGGILFGLGAGVGGEVVLGEGGDIVTQNFDRYEVMRMRTTPEIEVHLIDFLESPGGVGEVSVPSVAPALANAIAALTGTRVRRLPFSKSVKIR
jgi:isoquinoline 1-oxidoreductase beta subunit